MLRAGSDGETGQSSLWRRLRESEEPLSQTAAVSGDGEGGHMKCWWWALGMCVVLNFNTLKYVKTCLQVTDNISQNTILEYVMINSIFEAILQVGGQWETMSNLLLSFLSISEMYLFLTMCSSALSLPIQILSDVSSRGQHGYDAVVLLALLVNYRKYEVCVVYICWLVILLVLVYIVINLHSLLSGRLVAILRVAQ